MDRRHPLARFTLLSALCLATAGGCVQDGTGPAGASPQAQAASIQNAVLAGRERDVVNAYNSQQARAIWTLHNQQLVEATAWMANDPRLKHLHERAKRQANRPVPRAANLVTVSPDINLVPGVEVELPGATIELPGADVRINPQN